MHVHVNCPDGEAKFWLEPRIELAHQTKLSTKQIGEIPKLIEERVDEIKAAWKNHFAS